MEAPLVLAAVSHYRMVLENYECAQVMQLKADPNRLDVAKVKIANAILGEFGIDSYINDSKILATQQRLERIGEAPGPKRSAIPSWLRWKVFRRDGFRCVECGRGWDLHADHIVPWSKGGATTYENLATLCSPCNLRKSDKV